MTVSDTVTDHAPRPTSRRPGLPWWQAATAAAGAATAVNLVILLVADLAGASLVLREPGAADHVVTAAGVVVSSVGPLTAGLAAATLLSRWRLGFLRLAQVVGAGLALLTVAGPLTSGTDGTTAAALATMHVVVGVAVVAALEAVRRRAVADRAPTP
jgi:hypothetical protein